MTVTKQNLFLSPSKQLKNIKSSSSIIFPTLSVSNNTANITDSQFKNFQEWKKIKISLPIFK